MANRLLHKASTVAGKAPAAADMNLREIALNTADGLAYMLTTAGKIVTMNPPGQATHNGTTVYANPSCVSYAFNGVTDSNGRVTFNLTKDGTATGVAIFSTVFTRVAQAYATSTTNANNYPYVAIESFTAKTVTVRSLTGVPIAPQNNTTTFAGAGYRVDLFVTGAI